MKPVVILMVAVGALAGRSLAQQPDVAEKAVTAPAPAATSGEAKDTWLAVVGGTVWPVSDPVIRNGTVLVRNGKIVRVGRREDVVVPEGAQVVDATGRHVCPGFVCAAARGALGVRGNTLTEKAKDRFDPFSDPMLMCLAAGITTAHEGPGGRGGPFGGNQGLFSGSPKGQLGGVIGKLTYGTLDGFEIRDPAAVYLSVGATPTQLRENHESLKKGMEFWKARRQWWRDAAAGKKDLKEPKGDELTKALADVLDGDLTLVVTADDRASLLRAAELSRTYGYPMVIGGGEEAWTIAAEMGRSPLGFLITPRGRSSGIRPYTDEFQSRPHGWSIENAKRLSDAGIPWATVTLGSAVVTGLFAGRDITGLPHEACFAVRGGVSEDEALASITLRPAELLGISGRVGSLEVGKDGDLLVMDLEPLDYRSFVDLAFVNGRLAYDRASESLWNHIQTDRSQGMKPEWKPWGPWPELQEISPRGK